MIDRYERNINYLRVSITDRCNLRCAYCMPKEGISGIGHDDILRYEEILRIVQVATGEGITKILLETYAEQLFAAGIRRINISLDSLNADKYTRITRGGDIDAVLRGIRKVREIGFDPIKINIVAIKGFNDDEVLDFARLTLSNPYQIRFIELMSLGTAGVENNGRYLANSVIRQRIETLGTLEAVNGGRTETEGPARIYRLAGGAGEIGFISPVSHHFCHSCNRLRLTADGHLRACLLSDDETDLKGPLREGCGNEEIGALIRGVIARKPRRHDIACDEDHIKKCMKEMPAIGG
jgi:cyclic pyranopterin phosphate synthase